MSNLSPCSVFVKPAPTADSRYCDPNRVSVETLEASTRQHIRDVYGAMSWMEQCLMFSRISHDLHKLETMGEFHAGFADKFTDATWLHKHYASTRHHLNEPDGVRDDVNLFDVLEFIADCVVAGMGRAGSVYPLKLSPEMLERAFQNTAEALKSRVVLTDSKSRDGHYGEE